MQSVLLDAAGHGRSPATMPGYHRGRPPRNKGEQYPNKAVVSRSAVDLDRRQNSQVVEGDVPDWARRGPVERDVIIIGSGTLCDLFISAGAVDEYRLRVFPTVAGATTRTTSSPSCPSSARPRWRPRS